MMDEPAPPPTDTFIRIRFTGHEVRPDDDDRCRCRSHSRSPISLCVSPQLTYTDDGSKECVYYQIETEVRCPLFGVAIAVAARSLSCVDDRSLLLLLLLLLHSQSNLPDYPPSASVKRRFNEFLWLYDRLKEEWVSTQDRKDPVPKPVKPPPKKAIGT